MENGKELNSSVWRCGISASGYQPGPRELSSYPVVDCRTWTYHSLNAAAYLPPIRMPPGPATPSKRRPTSVIGCCASMTTWNAANSLRAAFSDTVRDMPSQTELEVRKSFAG